MAKYPALIQLRIGLEDRARLQELAQRHGQNESVLVRALVADLVERADQGDDVAAELLAQQADREAPLPPR